MTIDCAAQLVLAFLGGVFVANAWFIRKLSRRVKGAGLPGKGE